MPENRAVFVAQQSWPETTALPFNNAQEHGEVGRRSTDLTEF
jgi:hypothetical protein